MVAVLILANAGSVVCAQGQVLLNNRVGGAVGVDARVLLPDGTGAGAGFLAQLVLIQRNGTLTPLQPTATFRTSSAAAQGYVTGVVVDVPGTPPGSPANLLMRAYNGSSYDSATLRGESAPITVILGSAEAPAVLEGLAKFTLSEVGPLLHSALSGTNIVLSWPSSQSQFAVESTDAFFFWTPVSATPQIRKDTLSVTLPVSGGNKFYRLRGN